MTNTAEIKRGIKSFVRRSGRLTAAQKRATTEYWPLYGIDYEMSDKPVSNAAREYGSVYVEIGFGNGDALITMAGNNPDILFIGVEVYESGVGRCLNNIAINQLHNVKLIAHDAVEVMQYMIPPQSLDKILLFFPDPWHKKRHHKRRIVNQKFRQLTLKLLKPGGCLHLATDWQDYAEHMARELLSDARFANLGNSAGYAQRPGYRPLTKFEQRGLDLGHGVWDLVFQKIV